MKIIILLSKVFFAPIIKRLRWADSLKLNYCKNNIYKDQSKKLIILKLFDYFFTTFNF